jgi:branched-chain amino acid transport system substrate-binding protein
VKVGGTLSLTGFLAQTAVIHKIAAEIMVEDINSRNGFLGRPVEYVLLDDQSKPDVCAQPLREADHRRQGRPDPGTLRHGADPGGDGRRPALRQGDHPEQHGHPKLQTYEMAFRPRPSGPIRTRPIPT